jgi:glycerate 2-kinase
MDLRREALEIFNVALASVDAGNAVRRAVCVNGSHLTIQETTFDISKTPKAIYALAIGKAAFPMAVALDELLGAKISEGLVVGTYIPDLFGKLLQSSQKAVTRWHHCDASHPLPTQSSLDAAKSAFDLLKRANEERALVIFLISGGGSSMIEWPRSDEIPLEDLRAANKALVTCGAGISEINAVRRRFSMVKGGGLAARAPNADQITLIISDVEKGQESIVASGPTFDTIPDSPDAAEVVAQYNLLDQLPKSILKAIAQPIDSPATTLQKGVREHYVLLDNETALVATSNEARRRGFVTEIAIDISNQPIAEGCQLMLARLHELQRRPKNPNEVVCLISGGEFSCPVRGDGVGGRNAETVLRCAIELNEFQTRKAPGPAAIRVTVLSAGTDGIDGNSPAAGALANEETVKRAAKLGLNASDYLEQSDAYSFLNALGDTFVTGPTGTNVRDIRIAVACRG